MNKNFKSSVVDVFPTTRRNDKIDRNARLTSEQNLISFITRLTKKDSFIINGLQVNQDNTLSSGSCSIHGYLFMINFGAEIFTVQAPQEGKSLYLKIKLSSSKVDEQLTGTIEFKELVGEDSSEDSRSIYSGLEIVVGDTVSPNFKKSNQNEEIYTLKIANAITLNGVLKWENDKLNTLKYISSDLEVTIPNGLITNINESKTNMQTFITTNLKDIIIDDGQLE